MSKSLLWNNTTYKTLWGYFRTSRGIRFNREQSFFFFLELFLPSTRHTFAREAFNFFPCNSAHSKRRCQMWTWKTKQTWQLFFPHLLLTLRLLLNVTLGYCQVLQTRCYMGVRCLCKHFGIDLLFFLFLLLNLQLDSLHLVDDSCGGKETKTQLNIYLITVIVIKLL